MTIIFLDIDGVLRTHLSDLYWSTKLGKPIPDLYYQKKLSKESVKNLNEILFYTRSKIVITSTWRTQLNLQQLKNVLKENGVTGEVIGTTSIIGNRGDEIEEWVNRNRIIDYVVIDDNINDIINIIPKSKIHKIDNKYGITTKDVDIILDIIS